MAIQSKKPKLRPNGKTKTGKFFPKDKVGRRKTKYAILKPLTRAAGKKAPEKEQQTSARSKSGGIKTKPNRHSQNSGKKTQQPTENRTKVSPKTKNKFGTEGGQTNVKLLRLVNKIYI